MDLNPDETAIIFDALDKLAGYQRVRMKDDRATVALLENFQQRKPPTTAPITSVKNVKRA